MIQAYREGVLDLARAEFGYCCAFSTSLPKNGAKPSRFYYNQETPSLG